MRKTFIAALICGLAALAAAPADAMVSAGEKAPAWEVKESINLPTTSVDVQSLQGRVVLMEIFRTW